MLFNARQYLSDRREESQRCALLFTAQQRDASPPFSMTMRDALKHGVASPIAAMLCQEHGVAL